MAESPDVPWAKNHDHRIRKPFSDPPSPAAVFFLEFLKSVGISGGRMIDLGCGNGRNAIFFAKEGFEVHAVDRSEDVLKDMDLHGVMPHCHSVTEIWLFEDGFFDFAMDIFCYECQIDPERKKFYRSELSRVLKENGTCILSLHGSTSLEDLEREFSGFEILKTEKNIDKIDGKNVEALNVIMRKK
jgi:ubiquinone/menaquinone biosynthesis C-methylase UbiE